jgi:hypothetical protein
MPEDLMCSPRIRVKPSLTHPWPWFDELKISHSMQIRQHYADFFLSLWLEKKLANQSIHRSFAGSGEI